MVKARTIDELKGALLKLQIAFKDDNVKFVMDELKRVADEKLMQDFLAKGEEAVRAMGFQQGIGVIRILPDIMEQSILVREAQDTAQIKKKLQI